MHSVRLQALRRLGRIQSKPQQDGPGVADFGDLTADGERSLKHAHPELVEDGSEVVDGQVPVAASRIIAVGWSAAEMQLGTPQRVQPDRVGEVPPGTLLVEDGLDGERHRERCHAGILASRYDKTPAPGVTAEQAAQLGPHEPPGGA